MIKFLYDNDIIIYTYAGLCALGLLLRLIINLVYKHLVKESDNLGETKNKMLKHIKMKFETCYKLKIGVNNVDTFVDKNILKHRFCGILLSTWDNLCGQALFLNLLAVPIIAIFGVVYKCGQDRILLAGAVGILTSAIMILVDKSINLTGKKKIMRLNLLDYLENFCKVRLEQEAIHPELTSQLRKEYVQAAESGKQISAAFAQEPNKVEVKDELNRRRETRLKKEEERKLLIAKKEEEQKKAEEIRKEEERKKLEEKKLAASRRREEERLRIEEERQALEARREELKHKAQERQRAMELKKQQEHAEKGILHYPEEELNYSAEKSDMDILMEGLEEIAAEKERNLQAKTENDAREKERQDKELAENSKKQKTANTKTKTQAMSIQEEKLIEDVLKEFFA